MSKKHPKNPPVLPVPCIYQDLIKQWLDEKNWERKDVLRQKMDLVGIMPDEITLFMGEFLDGAE